MRRDRHPRSCWTGGVSWWLLGLFFTDKPRPEFAKAPRPGPGCLSYSELRRARKRKKPRSGRSGAHDIRRLGRSDPRAVADHEGIVGVFGDLPPQILVIAERERRLPDLLEVLIRARDFLVELERGLEAGVHDGGRERTKLRAAGDQALERGP